METVQVKIDFVTAMPDGGCRLVLVETGPWPEAEKQQNLERLAKRITDCFTAILNGFLAERYPVTAGKAITIEVDSYDTPRLEVDILVAKAGNALKASPEAQEELRRARFTPGITVLHRWSSVEKELAKRSLWGRTKRALGFGE
jgi:hypothetical protein